MLLVQPSHCRRPQPIEELASALPERVTLAVDISHTAGLIAAGLLPQPLVQGADILTFNTHKTLPGPNKGVIAFADRDHPLAETMWETICPQLQSNSHAECLPGLVIALEEIAAFGPAYAEQVIANARTLAQVLYSNGLACPEWSTAALRPTRFTCTSARRTSQTRPPTNCCRCAASARTR